MIYITHGSHAYNLLSVLSVTSEIPVRSLYLFGSERVYKALVRKMSVQQTVKYAPTGDVFNTKLVNISGKGGNKTIRLYKTALPILKLMGTYEAYISISSNHKFRGDKAHIERNHRIAESVIMSMRSGTEFRIHKLPELQNREIKCIISYPSVFFTSRYLKGISQIEFEKTSFTRMVGALFADGKCYAVYNTRNTLMKWSGTGELKARYALAEIARLNSDATDIDSAILFGETYNIALETLLENEKRNRCQFGFEDIYRHLFYITLNEFGIQLFRLFCISVWRERILDVFFKREHRSFDQGHFEYDAYVDGKYIYCFLDSDIARLIRFREALTGSVPYRCEVMCFPEQTDFIKAYLGDSVSLRVVELQDIETELRIANEKI